MISIRRIKKKRFIWYETEYLAGHAPIGDRPKFNIQNYKGQKTECDPTTIIIDTRKLNRERSQQ